MCLRRARYIPLVKRGAQVQRDNTHREENTSMGASHLIEEARAAAQYAVAPYSQFPVGAAVETASGRTVHGCNVESASYGLTVCAERVAIFSALAAGERPVRLAVTCLKGNPAEPTSLTPCGACRQVMLDQMGPDAEVYVDGVGEMTVDELLPKGFRLP
jgi:cytidine deaminase